MVRVYLLVAVLSYSGRLFVEAFSAERQDDWLQGVAAAFPRSTESRVEFFAAIPAGNANHGVSPASWTK
jgi:hypothetical protein